MRHNRFIIALLVAMTGFFILAPQAYTLYRVYLWSGEKITATHLVSNKATNSKDTVMMPIYSATRQIGPLKQECKIAVFELVHALDKPPLFQQLQLKLGATCADYVLLNDAPRTAFILFALGLVLFGLGLNLIRLAWRTA
jgi:hypothetical protein